MTLLNAATARCRGCSAHPRSEFPSGGLSLPESIRPPHGFRLSGEEISGGRYPVGAECGMAPGGGTWACR
jgi:hypothetical protein